MRLADLISFLLWLQKAHKLAFSLFTFDRGSCVYNLRVNSFPSLATSTNPAYCSISDSVGQVGYGRLPAHSPESLPEKITSVAENSLPLQHIQPPLLQKAIFYGRPDFFGDKSDRVRRAGADL